MKKNSVFVLQKYINSKISAKCDSIYIHLFSSFIIRVVEFIEPNWQTYILHNQFQEMLMSYKTLCDLSPIIYIQPLGNACEYTVFLRSHHMKFCPRNDKKALILDEVFSHVISLKNTDLDFEKAGTSSVVLCVYIYTQYICIYIL